MRIVTNGCFDCFHDGHRRLIEKALKWSNGGEVLILLNSDDSIQKLKGLDRPQNTFQIRKEDIEVFRKNWSIKHMEYPDVHVVRFDTEEQLLSCINNFEPDIVIKESGRSDMKEIVDSLNWPICFIPRSKNKKGEDISTTDIIQRMKSE